MAKKSKPEMDMEMEKAKDEFIKELVKAGATILTKEESAAILANTEFDGCIARPKNPSNQASQA